MLPFEDTFKKVFLAGIGAVATTFEAANDMVEKMVKKGEITVEQGKVLNEELKHNFQQAVKPEKKPEQPDLLSQLDSLTPEQLQQLKQKLDSMEKPGE